MTKSLCISRRTGWVEEKEWEGFVNIVVVLYETYGKFSMKVLGATGVRKHLLYSRPARRRKSY